jgi:hypothetical protein
MDVYGNTLVTSRTNEYLNNVYKILIKFICGDKSYKGPLSHMIDLSQLTFKEKDDIVDIFKAYDSKVEYNIEKYRDDRLRYLFKERYDVKDNLIDWDYHQTFVKVVRFSFKLGTGC